MVDEDDDNTPSEPAGKGLRAQLEKVLAEKAEVEKNFADLKAQARTFKVDAVLKARGVNPKVSKFIGDDVEDIDAWLDDNSDVFGFTLSDKAPDEPAAPNIPSESVQETRRVQNLNQMVLPASKAADLENRIKAANNDKELDAVWDEARSFFL